MSALGNKIIDYGYAAVGNVAWPFEMVTSAEFNALRDELIALRRQAKGMSEAALRLRGTLRLRTGRRNPRALYLRMGAEPDDAVDLPIGLCIDTDAAALIGDGLNSPWHMNEIRLSVEARTDEPRLNGGKTE